VVRVSPVTQTAIPAMAQIQINVIPATMEAIYPERPVIHVIATA